jgi:4-hydroxy-3-polyprenylbenzoate decarboxylase
MQIDDLRDYLDILEEYQEVQRIDAEVDWNLEMGAITRRVYDLGAPAALFEKVKGYPTGFRALGAPLGTSSHPGHGQFARTALAMHMPPSSSAKEIMSTYLQRKEKLIPPVMVKTGPCKENIDIGDAVDVLKFPIPLIHGGDGGRYIGT